SSLTFVIDDMKYTGSELKPIKGKQIHAYASSADAKAKRNEITGDVYEVIGYSSNINSGTGKVTIHGLNNYGSTKVYNFKIVKISY
ncbi:MAG: hypothetical protein K5857_05760, partial [Lachnospiraceae bacterium]|nr:hypothetical protein [Lachnospiraceae bacterium]